MTRFEYEGRGAKDEVAKTESKLFAIAAVEAITALNSENNS